PPPRCMAAPPPPPPRPPPPPPCPPPPCPPPPPRMARASPTTRLHATRATNKVVRFMLAFLASSRLIGSNAGHADRRQRRQRFARHFAAHGLDFECVAVNHSHHLGCRGRAAIGQGLRHTPGPLASGVRPSSFAE